MLSFNCFLQVCPCTPLVCFLDHAPFSQFFFLLHTSSIVFLQACRPNPACCLVLPFAVSMCTRYII